MKYYMHPAVARQLLLQSVSYRAFRRMGWSMQQSRELSTQHAKQLYMHRASMLAPTIKVGDFRLFRRMGWSIQP